MPGATPKGNAEKFQGKEAGAVFNSAREVDREEFKLERQCAPAARAHPRCLYRSPRTSPIAPTTSTPVPRARPPPPDPSRKTLEKLDANGNPVKEKKFRGDVDGPGREARGQIIKKEKNHTGSVTSTPQTGPKRMYKMGDAELRLDVAKLNAYDAMQATMKEMGYDEGEEGDEDEGQEQQQQVLPLNVDSNRKYKMGDAELRLDVAKLNAFDAMQATMKEMGFDEGEEGEEEEEPEQQQASQSAAAPTGGGGSGGKRAQVQPSDGGVKIEDVGTLMVVARAASKFRPDAYRGVRLPHLLPPLTTPPPPLRSAHTAPVGCARRHARPLYPVTTDAPPPSRGRSPRILSRRRSTSALRWKKVGRAEKCRSPLYR